MIIFSTYKYKYLQQKVINLSFLDGNSCLIHKLFPDGERYHLFNLDLNRKDVVIIGGTSDDEETMELYDLCCGSVMQGAKTLTIIIPYFGYSTMERAVKRGEVVKAKIRAQLISSIPHTNRNSVVLIDLHSEGIQHYFEGNIHTHHIYAKNIIMNACKEICPNGFVLGSTDAGRAKWVESLAKDMNTECALIIKRRLSGSETEIAGINADVKGKEVIIYDDMIRTGGSLIKAAQAYMSNGAKSIHAIATHGILPGDSLEKIRKTTLFTNLIVTNTHPNVNNMSSGSIKIMDISPIIKEFLTNYC